MPLLADSRTGRRTAGKCYSPEISQLWAVDVKTQGGVAIGNPVALPRQVANVVGPGFDYDVMPDGRLVATSAGWAGSERQEIQVVLNWFEELKRLVPVK